MSSPSLAPSPAPPAAPPPPRRAVPAPLRRPRLARPTGRPTRGSLALSLGLHVVVLGGLWMAHPLVRPLPTTSPSAPPATANSAGESVSFLDLAEFPEGIPAASPGGAPVADPFGEPGGPAADTATAAAALPPFPTTVPTRLPAAGVPATGGRGAPSLSPGVGPAAPGPRLPGAGGASGPGGLGTRGFGDRRLWVTPEAVPNRPLTREEEYRRHFLARLEQIQDSTLDEMEHQRRIRNWTFRGRDGKEYGIAEGGVPVIAGRRLPVPPIQLGQQDRDQEDAARGEASQRREIDRQAEDVSRERHLRDRQRVVRQRADSIRAARKAEEERAREAAGEP